MFHVKKLRQIYNLLNNQLVSQQSNGWVAPKNSSSQKKDPGQNKQTKNVDT